MTQPFFSIIVVSYNAEATIRKTVESVLTQDFGDYEIVVKDAASSDGTVAALPESDKIRLFVRPDGGIYDGMNEAIREARGKYLLFLNCGDYLASSDVLSRVYEVAKSLDEHSAVLYGDYTRSEVLFKSPSSLSLFYLFRTPLCHQTVFFGSGVFERFPSYDTSYRIMADYDLTLKAFRGGFSYVYVPAVISDYLGGGVSESDAERERKAEEYARIIQAHFTKRERRRFERKLFFSFRWLRQRLISDRSPKWLRRLYRRLVNRING